MGILRAMTLCAAALALAHRVEGQRPVTRAEAVAAALSRGPRLPRAAADTAAARALFLGARSYQNPILAASYSKATPQYHVTAELPVDFPWLRRARIASASAVRDAARDRFAFERAAVTFDAETTYTNAQVAAAHAQLSRRNAQAADSLLRIARARRDAGDASELDVQLATVFAGTEANRALSDSLALVAALLDLQTLMGEPSAGPTIALRDSLMLAADTAAGRGVPLSVSAASSVLRAAEQSLSAEQHTVFGSAAIQFGFENRDPTGTENGILPLVGIALPFPLFNRNEPAIAAAEAERNRARADVDVARLESARDIARVAHARDLFVSRVALDGQLLASADRVASMSLTAYREGAVPLTSVLEAQRNARETLAQYIDDLGAANDAVAALRLLTASASQIP